MKIRNHIIFFALLLTQLINAQTEIDKTKILILGTYHLNQIPDFNPEMLDEVVVKLDSYEFDAICIENMSGELLYDIQSRNDSAFQDVLDGYGGNRLLLADSLQEELNISFLEAQHKTEEILQKEHLSELDRQLLINYFMASTDMASATLQFQYLNEKSSLQASGINSKLKKLASSSNEIYALAIRLAKNQNLQKLEYIDNLQDESLLFKYYPMFMQDYISNQDLFSGISNHPAYEKVNKKLKSGIITNDLFELYQYLNSKEYHDQDFDAQWSIWFKTNFPSGSDRARYSLWEMRNLQITANILKTVSLYPKKNILVIIGASHKFFIEKYLKQIPDIELLEFK